MAAQKDDQFLCSLLLVIYQEYFKSIVTGFIKFLLVKLNEVYSQWHHDIKNGHRIGGTLMFSSTDAYEENFLIAYNLLEKEDMVV